MFTTKTPRARLRTPLSDTPISASKKQLIDPGKIDAFPGSVGSTPGRMSTPMKYERAQPLSSVAVPQQAYLMKSSTHSLSQLGSIPPEITGFLKNLNFEVEDVQAVVDYASGYCAISTQSNCFVWQGYKRGISSYSLIQQLPVPEHESSFLKAPLIAIVPSSTQDPKQAGLLMCTHDGRLRFWDTLEFGSDQFIDCVLDISKDEFCAKITNCEPAGFIVTSTLSNMFKIVLYDNDARPCVSVSSIATSKGLFGLSKSQRTKRPDNELITVFPGSVIDQRASRDLYLITRAALEKWNLQRTVGDRLVLKADVYSLIHSKLENELQQEFSFRILDAQVTKSKQVAVLVSFSMHNSPLIYYSIALFSESVEEIAAFYPLNFNMNANASDSEDAELLLVQGGPLAILRFSSGILLKYLDRSNSFEREILLKSPLENPLLAFSCSLDVSGWKSSDLLAEFVCLTLESGVLGVQIDLSTVKSWAFDPSNYQDKTRLLENVLEQAVTFGMSERIDNPLLFDYKKIDGNLDQAVTDLSDQILGFIPKSLVSGFSINLAERFRKLDNIMKFISDSSQLSETSRIRLLYNTEKALGALELWNLIEQTRSLEILRNAIHSYSGVTHDDFLQEFLSSSTSDLGRLMNFVNFKEGNAAEIIEISQLMLSVFSTRQYRDQMRQFYGLADSKLVVEPWDANIELIDLQERITNSIQKLLSQRLENSQQLSGLLDSMVELLVGTYSYFIEYASLTYSPEQLQSLNKRFKQSYIQSIGYLGNGPKAFEICEKFRLFDYLVRLALPANRIEEFMERYSRDFAFVLYDYYLANDMQRDLLNQPTAYHGMLKEFLARSNVDNIKWIHDVTLGEFDQASNSLLKTSQNQVNFEKKKLCLNIARLCYLASVESDQDPTVATDLAFFERETEFLSVHEAVKQRFLQEIPPLDNTKQQSEAIISKFYPKTLAKIVATSIEKLLCNQVLSIESFIDLLTLSNEPSWFKDAVEICFILLEEQQEKQFLILRRIWRRGILQKDWPEFVTQSRHLSASQVKQLIKETALYHLIAKTKDLDESNVIPQPDALLAEDEEALLNGFEYQLDKQEIAQFKQVSQKCALNDIVQECLQIYLIE